MLSPDGSAPANKGQFASERDALTAVVDRLVRAIEPSAIWLFGSRARGDARPESDFDLLVVVRPGVKVDGGSYYDIYDPVRGMGLGLDVVPCSYEDFEEGRSEPHTMVAQIVKEGRLLYEARPN